ncbi:MAG: hypothetical protein IKS17_00890 [Firmicutes bacterium]|nr:hypothetical protein [Bacillota bacterium]
MKSKTKIFAAAAVFTLTAMLSACGGSQNNISSEGNTAQSPVAGEETSESSTAKTNGADIDLDKLNNSAEAIKNLDINTDISINGSSKDSAENTAPKPSKPAADEPEGEKTVYSYADVYRTDDGLTLIPNGGMNGSTVLYGGKDLNGFLDYVDSTVLEEGRRINRDFFYDIMATVLVDKELSSDFDRAEKYMIMALAVANNFHAMNVRVNDCRVDANNAADYRYNVTAYDKDDTWIINYEDRTFYMNDGKTEYHSEMFKDEYLAVWMMAIDEYYGITR